MDNKNTILPNWKEISKVLKYKKKDFDNLLVNYVNHKKEIYNEVKKIKKEDRNFENTILALENSDAKFVDKLYQIISFSLIHKDKEFRDNSNEFNKNLSEKIVDLNYDKDIYLAVKDYIEGNYKKEKKALDQKYGAGSVKLALDSYREYKRMGFDLPKAKQDKLKNNYKNISRLSLDFEKNINEYSDFILCSDEEIKGLPENFVKTLEKVDGKYKITLDYPSIGPFLQYADSREKRKEIADKNARKGGEKNLKILSEIIKFRNDNAKLLGYKNHVEFTVENRMAKSENIARKFIESTIKKIKPQTDKEFIELNNFAKNNLENYKSVKQIEYFDSSYVINKYKENKYSIDNSKLKEYFELENVLNQMFNIFGNLFNFTAREIEEKEKKEKGIILADKELKLFELKDKKSKKIISYLMLDLFPREGKYDHACHCGGLNGYEFVKLDLIICNFQRPTKNLPSLLTFREVEVLFHEFGHAVHGMLSNAKYFSQAGTNCDHDFVEVPSQMMENFLKKNQLLKKIAIHYSNKKILDKINMDRLINSLDCFKATGLLKTFILSLFDIEMHSGLVPINNNGKSIALYASKLNSKYSNFAFPKESTFPSDWGHMAGGYDAGYYSYMWALVYAQDFYSEFKKVENNKNKLKEIGERYRKEILEVGGSRDEMESVKKFLKRAPNNKAFLKEIGTK